VIQAAQRGYVTIHSSENRKQHYVRVGLVYESLVATARANLAAKTIPVTPPNPNVLPTSNEARQQYSDQSFAQQLQLAQQPRQQPQQLTQYQPQYQSQQQHTASHDYSSSSQVSNTPSSVVPRINQVGAESSIWTQGISQFSQLTDSQAWMVRVFTSFIFGRSILVHQALTLPHTCLYPASIQNGSPGKFVVNWEYNE
jgi:hypothetical protein